MAKYEATLSGQIKPTIDNWQRAGLLLPSVIRLGKIATLHKRFINKKLGNLSKDDITKIKEIIKNIFKIGNITS